MKIHAEQEREGGGGGRGGGRGGARSWLNEPPEHTLCYSINMLNEHAELE